MAKRKTSRVRVKGLVSLMNYVREQLSIGIPAGQAEEFRAIVQDNLRTVERICREQHTTPAALPTPSRRAYAYLKSLDLTKLPLLEKGQTPQRQAKIRVNNIIALSNDLHYKFEQMACERAHWRADAPQMDTLQQELSSHVAAIADLCKEQGGSPIDLPTRSRRGYQWLAFLSEPDNLALHLNTLATAQKIGSQKPCRQALPKAQRDLPLYIEIYNTSSLFRTRVQGEEIQLTLHEGYIGAPHAVLKAAICAALGLKKYLDDAKAYMNTESFTETVTDLELTTADLSPETQGHIYDLAEVFARVNAAYFEGAMERPNLTWNRTLTYRKMGHYNNHTDTVMISITLDHKRVPQYVIDYVMYHELLHKHFGVNLVNGRRLAHTPEFRAAELEFKHYKAAKKFMRQMQV